MSPTPINLSVTEPSTSFSSSSSNAKPLKKTPPSKNSSLPFVYTASPDGIDENLLILFHGLGDNPTNFIQFGKKMRLPQTACLAIKAPFPIPFFDEGTSWFSSFDACGECELFYYLGHELSYKIGSLTFYIIFCSNSSQLPLGGDNNSANA